MARRSSRRTAAKQVCYNNLDSESDDIVEDSTDNFVVTSSQVSDDNSADDHFPDVLGVRVLCVCAAEASSGVCLSCVRVLSGSGEFKGFQAESKEEEEETEKGQRCEKGGKGQAKASG